jgi:aminoglycoside phosphotransferase
MPEKDYSLKELLEKHVHRQIFTGWSGAEAYYLPGLAAYLKIAPLESPSDLSREKEVLEWLAGKLSVPKALGFEKTNDKQLILISEIKGRAVSDHVAANRHDMVVIRDCVKKTAAAMRQIHDLPIAECPFKQDIDTKLAAARENIRRGFVDESDFDREHQGRSAAKIYNELVEKKTASRRPCFYPRRFLPAQFYDPGRRDQRLYRF